MAMAWLMMDDEWQPPQMGDSSFMLSNIMNTSCQNSQVSGYSFEHSRNPFAAYSGPPESNYCLNSPHIITSISAMPVISNGFPDMTPHQIQPELKIIEEPQQRIRYRYASEKGAHGGMHGISSSPGKKTFPQVKLFNGPPQKKVHIKASLYTIDQDPKPHVHKLTSKQHCNNPNGDCIADLNEENIATFQNLGILFIGKKEAPKMILERKKDSGNYLLVDESILREEAEKEAKSLQYNSVRICFEAIDSENCQRICHPVYSTFVLNQNSGELKISRISKCSGCCIGGDEVFLLCEKVNKKEIKIRFYEEQDNEIVWEEDAVFNEADVHHQVAIVFKTPPYRNRNIEQPVKVFLQLYRRSDNEASGRCRFMYTPVEKDQEQIEHKRMKLDCKDSNQFFLNSYTSQSSSAVNRTHKMPSSSYDMLQSTSTYQSRGGGGSSVQMQDQLGLLQRPLDDELRDIRDLIVIRQPTTPSCHVSSTTSSSSVLSETEHSDFDYEIGHSSMSSNRDPFMGAPLTEDVEVRDSSSKFLVVPFTLEK